MYMQWDIIQTKNKTFVKTWLDLDGITLNVLDKERQIPYDLSICGI